MAYIEGVSLAEKLTRQGRYEDPTQVVGLACQVLDALEEVHGRGIIHRDLKPGNIMLDLTGHAVLTDFGLARALEDTEGLTAEGVIVGTPAYMAPEQAAGEQERIGPWTDLYSLGVILYRVLTGELPFLGTAREVIAKILHQPARRPSDLRPGLPPNLEAVVLKALNKEPSDRFQSAQEFRAALADSTSFPQVPIPKQSSAQNRPPVSLGSRGARHLHESSHIMQPATGKLLRGVYFPGEIDYLNNQSEYKNLKKGLVYFDEILTLVPEMTFTGDNYCGTESGFFMRPQRVARFLNDTAALVDAGILRCINPVENIAPSQTHFYSLRAAKVEVDRLDVLSKSLPELLFAGIVEDIRDDRFRSIVEQLKLEPIPLFTGQLEINWFGMLADTGGHRDLWDHPDRRLEYGGFSAYVSPQLGAAVLLNHALITAIKNQAIPIANNLAFDRLLRHKLSRMSRQTKELLQAARAEIPWERDTLASTVLDIHLPDVALQ
jgi:hypothetical protein